MDEVRPWGPYMNEVLSGKLYDHLVCIFPSPYDRIKFSFGRKIVYCQQNDRIVSKYKDRLLKHIV